LEDRTVPVVYKAVHGPLDILDNASTNGTIVITDSYAIGDLNVSLDIDHTFDGDLSVELIAPDLTRVSLFALIGGSGEGFKGTTLDDEATGSIYFASAPFTGVFRIPAGALSVFDGKDVQGTWELAITDFFSGDEGVLNSWSLDITPDLSKSPDPPAPPPPFSPSGSILPPANPPGDLASMNPTEQNLRWDGSLDAMQNESFYPITLTEAGRLTAQVVATSSSTLDPRLALLTLDHQELVRSDDVGAALDSAQINQLLTPGTYLLRVSSQGTASSGDYTLQANVTTGLFPDGVWGTGDSPSSVVVADVNDDGNLDVIAANLKSDDVSVLLGNGNGSFQTQMRLTVGTSPESVAVGYVNDDNWLDIIVANSQSNDVSVLLGSSTGTFQAQRRFAVGTAPRSVAVADVDGNGTLDVIAVNTSDNDLSVLLGNGEGSFQSQHRFDTGVSSKSVSVADVNGDMKLDLIVANTSDNDVSVLLGNGDGSFQRQARLGAGNAPVSVAVADVNGDGNLDLVTANTTGNNVSVLLGNGAGIFLPQVRYATGTSPKSVTVLDVNHDDKVDLVVANFKSNDVSVLLGNGDGTFRPEIRVATGASPRSVFLADVNEDGYADLVTANLVGDSVSVLLGNGDGSFQSQGRVAAGTSPSSVVVKDVNGDGSLDLISSNLKSNDVSVLLGNGDGSFQPQRRYAAGTLTATVVVEDVNGDGRLDLVTANLGSSTVSVLLGNGDGSFQPQTSYFAGLGALRVAVGDLNGDGKVDLVTANLVGNNVSLLLGKGDGSFQLVQQYDAGISPFGVTLGDVNGDNNLDVVVITLGLEGIVLLGNGHGTFTPRPSFFVGINSFAVVLADLNNDTKLDLIAPNIGDINASILLGNGDGSFNPLRPFPTVGNDPAAVAAADLNGDGFTDVIVANLHDNDVSVLLGSGDGTFQPQSRFGVGVGPVSVSVADVNSDGKLDLVTANLGSNDLTVLLGNGNGGFSSFAPERLIDLRHTPHRGDLDGDGTADTVILNAAGQILFRKGIPGTDNLFAPPVIINRDHPARDIALVNTDAGLALAASDTQGTRISVYTATGATFARREINNVGGIPQRLASADLDGDGLDDLVITHTLANTVTIAFQQSDGSFRETGLLAVGVAPSDIAIADMDGQNGLDVVVSNRSSGDVSVLFNDPTHSFNTSARYRAGIGESGLQLVNGVSQPQSREEPVSIVAGLFSNDTRPDVIVVDRGTHRFDTLLGTSGGGLTNPQEAFRFSTSQGFQINTRPGQTIAGDFDRDGKLDVAILMEDRGEVWIYKGQGDGKFTFLTSVAAGLDPTGLNSTDINADGIIDLMVGNGFGDVLFVVGNKDYTPTNSQSLFRAFVRADQHVPFVTTDLNGDGILDVILASQAQDVASAQVRTPGTSVFTPSAFQRDGSNGLIGPGDIAEADVDGLYGTDLIFANTGSNNVLVYLRQADGRSFASTALTFFAGTTPTDLHVTQLNDDNNDNVIDELDLLDLVVANQGSNDVSVLFGSHDAQDHWTFTLGPRLRTSGQGPNAVTTRDVVRRDGTPGSDGIPDILATNGFDGSLGVMPGIGSVSSGLSTGFFDDGRIVTQVIASGPVLQTIVTDTFIFALGQDGRIFRDGVSVFGRPTGNEVAVFSVVGDMLVTANRGGTISVLTPDEEGYSERAFETNAALANPSALEFLSRLDGLVDIYLTNAGDLKPIVITLDLRPELVRVGPTLALAVTLLADLPGDDPTLVARIRNAEGLSVLTVSSDTTLAFPQLGQDDEDIIEAAGKALLARLDGGTEEQGTEENYSEPTTVQEFVRGLPDALEKVVAAAKEEKQEVSVWQEWLSWSACTEPTGNSVNPTGTTVNRIPSTDDATVGQEAQAARMDAERSEPVVVAGCGMLAEGDPFVPAESRNENTLASGWADRRTVLAALASSAVFASGIFALSRHCRTGKVVKLRSSPESVKARR